MSNAGASAITVTLTSTSSGGRFYSNSGGSNQISSITIPVGSSSSAGFYYKDSTAGTPTLTAAASSLTSATTQFTINNYQLVFTSGTSQSLSTNTMSSSITVQSQTSTGGHYTSGLTVNLATTSTGGAFYASATSSTPITSISIASGSYSATFYYKDSAAGTPTLTASSTGFTPATTTFTVAGPATQLVFTTGASQTLYTSQVSSIITVTREDVGGNAVATGGSITISLAKTSTTGAFYSSSGGTGSAITSVTISSGSSSATFYYKDTSTTTTSSTITASNTGLTSATTTFTITPNVVANAGFESATGGWTTTTSNSGVECHIQSGDPGIPAHSGSHFAEIDTTGLNSGTSNAYSALIQTFSPGIPISSIPNVAGSFTIWVYNNGYSTQGSNGYYSFELIFTASNGNELIFWWGSSPATVPASTSTVTVINEGTLAGTFTLGQWAEFSVNLYQACTGAGWSTSTTISSLTIQDNGYYQSSSVQYGQELFIDDAVIQ